MEYDSKQDTYNHICNVRIKLCKAVINLLNRAEVHDKSKLEEPEKSIFDKCGHTLNQMKFGSPEYTKSLEELGPALKHHYENNSHHPQFYQNGIDGMSLFDLVEMLVDWKASSERMQDGGDIYKSIEINKKRFGISDQLEKILVNTAKEMGWKGKE